MLVPARNEADAVVVAVDTDRMDFAAVAPARTIIADEADIVVKAVAASVESVLGSAR